MAVTQVLPNAVAFAAMIFYPTGSSPAEIVGADFDKDGAIDLAVPNYYSNTVSILLNTGLRNGPISFASPVNYASGNRPWGIDAGDLNLDNYTDLVVTNVAENTVSILYGVSVLFFRFFFFFKLNFFAVAACATYASAIDKQPVWRSSVWNHHRNRVWLSHPGASNHLPLQMPRESPCSTCARCRRGSSGVQSGESRD
jgi:hypothetical protein